MTRPCPDLDLDLVLDLEWDLELDNFQSFEDKNSNILLYALCFAFMILDAEHIVQCALILK